MVINLKIERIVVGELQENCYIVTKENKSIIIDPGDELDKIIDKIRDKNIVGILITHHHFDHIGALSEIEKYLNIKANNDINYFDLEVIKTPGHTSDSVTFYFKEDKVMFTGDFLFERSIGRMDLPTGSYEDMKKSLEKIKEYPQDITIYPGHGNSSMLGKEIPYFNFYLG